MSTTAETTSAISGPNHATSSIAVAVAIAIASIRSSIICRVGNLLSWLNILLLLLRSRILRVLLHQAPVLFKWTFEHSTFFILSVYFLAFCRHISTHINMYIYIYVCVCVCIVCAYMQLCRTLCVYST